MRETAVPSDTAPRRRRRLALIAAFAAALVAASLTAVNALADVSAQAMAHKSPFNCGKTYYANNWTGNPPHNPSNTIDWQNYGGNVINGETVRATAAGTAHFRDAGSTSYGKWVEVVHTDGTRTRYAHLATMVRAAGASMSVSQGTAIGTVGSTGGSRAPHLHYEQRNANNAVVTPVVEGVQVPLGTKKAITSTNACSGSNPYTPGEVCGSGYTPINSRALGTAATIYLMYNSSNGHNCVVTIKHTNVGTPTAVSATLQVQGQTAVTDSGSFSYYAGPIRRAAPGTCVKWGGSVGSTSWVSDWSHCG
jgi:murein DD-endopeptidase MepM/ murein hydrolase activator NlpD